MGKVKLHHTAPEVRAEQSIGPEAVAVLKRAGVILVDASKWNMLASINSAPGYALMLKNELTRTREAFKQTKNAMAVLEADLESRPASDQAWAKKLATAKAAHKRGCLQLHKQIERLRSKIQHLERELTATKNGKFQRRMDSIMRSWSISIKRPSRKKAA